MAEGTPPTAQDVRALRAGLLELRGPAGDPVQALALLATLGSEAPARFRGPLFEALRSRVELAIRLLGAATDDGGLARDAHRLREIVDTVLSIAEAFERLAAERKGKG